MCCTANLIPRSILMVQCLICLEVDMSNQVVTANHTYSLMVAKVFNQGFHKTVKQKFFFFFFDTGLLYCFVFFLFFQMANSKIHFMNRRARGQNSLAGGRYLAFIVFRWVAWFTRIQWFSKYSQQVPLNVKNGSLILLKVKSNILPSKYHQGKTMARKGQKQT